MALAIPGHDRRASAADAGVTAGSTHADDD
jgi:hypothetical protein